MTETNNKPITVKGQYNEALVYAKAVEANCEDKIRQYLNHPAFAETKVRIMPDVHLGKSTVVGFTALGNAPVIPSLIGTDIGCGICACNLGRGNLRFDKLDAFIRKNIPAGMDVHPALQERLDEALAFVEGLDAEAGALTKNGEFKKALMNLCEKQKHSPERIFSALGSLGGGNHFIEVDTDERHNRWLLVHSGSRTLGAYTAEYHEILALRESPEDSTIKYLSGASADDYCADMKLVQFYARINRVLMTLIIAEDFFKVSIGDSEYRDCAHNYLELPANVPSGAGVIVRKGAISARKGEAVVIPFSMAEGAVLGRGLGNPDWNYSAPHGAGRKISRTQARQGLSLDEYRKRMRGIWSSTVGKDTLEESPMAYKRARDVLDYIGETVEIEERLKPVYNFKAAD
jgi:RNA-splicing ligase RtcB